MDEIEYKLNTNNSVLIVNAIDKLISNIKSKFKVVERQKFVVENEELKFLRMKCTSKDSLVSLTACQGLLALVQLGVLEIGHTMSTIVTLLPSAHNYSAIISTMAGLLTLDLKSRLVPGQPYSCQFSLRSPQHPFITVLERNKDAEDDVIAQMHALCNHPDYIISSNSLELLRPVFLWLTCECSRVTVSIRPWQLLLSLPGARNTLLLDCISCQQILNPKLIERAYAAYSAVTDAAIYQQDREYVVALLPMLARVSNELIKHGRDPRACYSLIERCSAVDAPYLNHAASLMVSILAENLVTSSALYLHELFNLCLNIISKYECSAISLAIFVALSLQWLHLPSYLTSSALKVASKILEIYQQNEKEDTKLHMTNLINNKIFQTLLYTDSHLTIVFKLQHIWERIRDNPTELKSWFDELQLVNDELKFELLPFYLGVMMEKRKDVWFEDIIVKIVDILTGLVSVKKEVSVQVLPILLYKIANDPAPSVKMACLKALPLMAKTKENVPTIVGVLNKLKTNKGVPTSFLIMLYTSLAETQVRCFPYLQEMLVDPGAGRPDDLKWETDIARAMAVKRICEIRPSPHGLELVSVISALLNKCTGGAGAAGAAAALAALAGLWRGAALDPHTAWRALAPRLARDTRPRLLHSVCQLLSEVPALRVSTPEYEQLVEQAARRLWAIMVESHQPEVVEAACDALANYRIEDYILRKTVKLPASHCKTPADAARNPEDVLDYIPCEIWPEVFKYTNQAALSGVERFVSKLIEREIRGYRSGVYQPDARVEPRDTAYLPPHSVIRGVMECFRKQATSPSYEFSEPVLLSILRTLTAEYPKPLPPVDLCFLHELYHRNEQWRRGSVKLAARQANTSGSARRFLENYLQGLSTNSEKSDDLLVFELLPILCRVMPPKILRPIIERCLKESYLEVANVKIKKDSEENQENYMFLKFLDLIRECFECEKIHDANRTLLSQIIESFFPLIPVDNISWPWFVRACSRGPAPCVWRWSSWRGWWEAPRGALLAAAALRCGVATAAPRPLVWLNDVIDAHAHHHLDQEFSLHCMVPVLKVAKVDDPATKEWFLQLLARTQVAFNETEEDKQYLCDVVMLSLVVLSGLDVMLGVMGPCTAAAGTREQRHELAPAAAALLARSAWADCTLTLVEWVRHTRDSWRGAGGEGGAGRGCQRILLALRHTPPFIKNNMWKILESHLLITNKNT